LPLTPRVRSVRGSTDLRGVIAQLHFGGTTIRDLIHT
jgi:hypothetical protein